jgi:hypothetical protein
MKLGSCRTRKQSGIGYVEGERKGLRMLWGVFSLGFVYSDMMVIVLVVQYGQTEAGGTMELLKELPADVLFQLMQSVLHQQ